MGGPGSGPRRRPTALKGIDGGKAPAKKTRGKTEPKPDAARVVRPVGLSPKARAHWDRLAPELIKTNLLTRWDVNLFAAYCEAAARREIAQTRLNKDGLFVPGQKGNLVKHPAVQVERDATEQMNRLGGKFGLTPSDRAGLKIPETPSKEGIARFR